MARPRPINEPVPVPPMVDESQGPVEYPKAMYRKVSPSDQRPMGYEARRVENKEQQDRLGPEWKDHPDEL